MKRNSQIINGYERSLVSVLRPGKSVSSLQPPHLSILCCYSTFLEPQYGLRICRHTNFPFQSRVFLLANLSSYFGIWSTGILITFPTNLNLFIVIYLWHECLKWKLDHLFVASTHLHTPLQNSSWELKALIATAHAPVLTNIKTGFYGTSHYTTSHIPN